MPSRSPFGPISAVPPQLGCDGEVQMRDVHRQRQGDGDAEADRDQQAVGEGHADGALDEVLDWRLVGAMA